MTVLLDLRAVLLQMMNITQSIKASSEFSYIEFNPQLQDNKQREIGFLHPQSGMRIDVVLVELDRLL